VVIYGTTRPGPGRRFAWGNASAILGKRAPKPKQNIGGGNIAGASQSGEGHRGLLGMVFEGQPDGGHRTARWGG